MEQPEGFEKSGIEVMDCYLENWLSQRARQSIQKRYLLFKKFKLVVKNEC